MGRHGYVIAGIFIALLLAGRPGTASPVTQGRLPVLRVDTTGQGPARVGLALGRAVKTRFPDVERRYDAFLARVVSQERFDRWLPERVEPLRRNGVDPAHRRELLGLADAWSLVGRNRLGDGYLSLDELWFLQFLPDLGLDGSGSGFGVYGRRSEDGAPLLGRNLGWPIHPALLGLQAITVYRGEERTLVNIGFAGLLGVVSGFNRNGLFLAGLKTPLRGTLPTLPAEGRAVGFDLRRALEQCTDGESAADLLTRVRHGAGHQVLIADRDGVAVLEQPPGSPGRRRGADSPTRPEMAWDKGEQLAAVNCFVLAHAPGDCGDLSDRYRWQRLRELARFRPTGPLARAGDLGRILLDRADRRYGIFQDDTVQSLVFSPRDGGLYLYARGGADDPPPDPLMQRYSDLLPRENEAQDSLWRYAALWGLLGVAAAVAGGILWKEKRG